MPVALNEPQSFDVAGKDRAWHTAFYYLAEHVRFLSRGALNHKELYALVGTEGRFINHENPVIRKRTAGALSRIVHTGRYVQDMRACYTMNGKAFANAAADVCGRIRASQLCDESELAEYLTMVCWPDVWRGLVNEKTGWRGDLDLARIDQEMRVLVASVKIGLIKAEPDAMIFAMILRLIAFGNLEITVSRALVDGYLTEELSPSAQVPDGCGVCLVKFADKDRTMVAGCWEVASDRPFTMGRYVDCDVVESNRDMSRVHACVYCRSGKWYFEDLGSRNGSEVVSGRGRTVFDSVRDGARMPVELHFGDTIVLARRCWYWFGALQDRNWLQ